MSGLRVLNTIEVLTNIGQCQIQLWLGDITTLAKEDEVDVLVLSAFPGGYSPTRVSLIGQLFYQLDVSVRELSKDKEEDLRKVYSCWWSKPLPANLSFKRILCFEGSFREGKRLGEVVGDVFRCLVSILAEKEGTVMMPILSSGAQGYSKIKMLQFLVKAAAHWMKAGLPLRCLKIVLFSKDISKLTKEDKSVIKSFENLKEIYAKKEKGQRKEFDEKAAEFDVYLSYSDDDKNRVEEIVKGLQKNKSDLRIFTSIQCLDREESWQEKLYKTITNCQRVMAIITPSYLQSSRCTEQYNIALCHSRKIQQSILVPLYVTDVQVMPTYMKLTQYIDCRIDYAEKIAVACLTIVSYLSVTAISVDEADDQKRKRLPSSQPYDIFLSYSHCNEKIAKKILNELKRHHPSLNIFIDTAELKAGGAWQQALYHALDTSKMVITLISKDYLRSKVCREELSLSIALHEALQCKLFPLIVEQLDQEVEWLRLLSPRSIFDKTAEDEKDIICRTCEDVMQLLSEPQTEKNEMAPLTCLAEEFRLLLFQREHDFESLLVSLSPNTGQNVNVRTDVRTNSVGNTDIYVIFSPDDSEYCDLLKTLILEKDPSVVIDTSSDGDTASSRLRFLDDARLIIPLLSKKFIESSDLVHELNIAWCRQRNSSHLCFLSILIENLPEKPTYIHLLPSFFNFQDKKWKSNSPTAFNELSDSLSIYKCPIAAVRCLITATNYVYKSLKEQEDCFPVDLRIHNTFLNSILLRISMQRVKDPLNNDVKNNKEENVKSDRKSKSLQTISNLRLDAEYVNQKIHESSLGDEHNGCENKLKHDINCFEKEKCFKSTTDSMLPTEGINKNTNLVPECENNGDNILFENGKYEELKLGHKEAEYYFEKKEKSLQSSCNSDLEIQRNKNVNEHVFQETSNNVRLPEKNSEFAQENVSLHVNSNSERLAVKHNDDKSSVENAASAPGLDPGVTLELKNGENSDRSNVASSPIAKDSVENHSAMKHRQKSVIRAVSSSTCVII